jgi:hypothetical protein
MMEGRRFEFRLALHLGMTRAELLQRVSARELTEWKMFFLLEPWGSKIDDQRAGEVALTMHRSLVGSKQTKNLTGVDMFPRPTPEMLLKIDKPKKKSWKQLLETAKSIHESITKETT